MNNLGARVIGVSNNNREKELNNPSTNIHGGVTIGYNRTQPVVARGISTGDNDINYVQKAMQIATHNKSKEDQHIISRPGISSRATTTPYSHKRPPSP